MSQHTGVPQQYQENAIKGQRERERERERERDRDRQTDRQTEINVLKLYTISFTSLPVTAPKIESPV